MLMRKKMILAVFIISVALGTESELQTRIIQFRTAAYRTAMMRAVGISHMRSGLLFEFCFPCLFPRAESFEIPRGQEKNNKIQEGRANCHPDADAALRKSYPARTTYTRGHPFHFNRQNKIQHYLHIRINSRKRQENGHGNIVCADQSDHRQRNFYSVSEIIKRIQSEHRQYSKQEAGKIYTLYRKLPHVLSSAVPRE